jgi:NADPH-dependent 2,4-dienoyl-CoA reductase/sulfur reductase-like enzyme
MKHHYKSMQTRHLIIIGGGFAGLELIKKLNNKPIKVTVLDKNNYFNFQPLMYQVASGGLGPDAIAYPLRKIISSMPNIAFRMAEVQEISTLKNEVITNIGNFNYDYLCIATGAQTNFFGNTDNVFPNRGDMNILAVPREQQQPDDLPEIKIADEDWRAVYADFFGKRGLKLP